MALNLQLTDIILGPVMSDLAHKRNQKNNELEIRVHMAANKPIIAKAVENLFNVKVERVNTFIRKGKVRRVGRTVTRGSDEKRAIVKLKEGHRLDLLGQATEAVPGQTETTT